MEGDVDYPTVAVQLVHEKEQNWRLQPTNGGRILENETIVVKRTIIKRAIVSLLRTSSSRNQHNNRRRERRCFKEI